MRHSDKEFLKDLLCKASNLNDDEFVIVARRYGLDGKEPLRVHELARMFSVTSEEIRRKTQWSLIKLRELTKDTTTFDELLSQLILIRKK